MKSVYLDNNSTTALDPRVGAALAEAYAENYANPASAHRAGQAARRKLDQLRTHILAAVGAETAGTEADRLVITSGGTEANNLALWGLAHLRAASGPDTRRVIVSSIEHPSVAEVAEQLSRQSFAVEKINVQQHGVCDMEHLQVLLEQPALLVSMMAVNNETGVIQPVAEAAELCRQAGVPFHTDAVQAIGKLPVHFRQLGCSALTLTAHKFHGPRGIGGLILRNDCEIAPLMFGGFQQRGTRPGTEDVALATGFCRAVQLAFAELDQRNNMLAALRDRFEEQLRRDLGDAIVIIGQDAPRAPHTSNMAFPGVDRQAFVLAADTAGICCSSGSACASGSSEPSPALLAMGRSASEIKGAIRFSFSWQLAEEDVTWAATQVAEIAGRLLGQTA